MIKSFLDSYIKNKKTYIFLFFLLSSASFFYSDTQACTIQGLSVWRALFDGHFFEYFVYYGSGYGIIMNIIMGLPLLPIAIIEQVCHIYKVTDVFWVRVYVKLVLVVIAFITTKIFGKIIYQLTSNDDKAKYSELILLVSCPLLVCVAIIGQVDIYGLLFVLLATYYLQKDRMLLFVLFYILAGQCKFIPMVILIPMLLVKEKKLLKLFAIIVAPIVVSVVVNIPFKLAPDRIHDEFNSTWSCIHSKYWFYDNGDENSNDIADMPLTEDVNENDDATGYEETKYTESLLPSNGMVSFELYRLLSDKVYPLGSVGVPKVFIFYIAICLFAYFANFKKEEQNKWIMYMGFMAVLSFIRFFESPYRLIYIVPFIIAMMLDSKISSVRAFVIEIIAFDCMIFAQMLDRPWCFELSNMRNMLVDKIIPLNKVEFRGLNYINERIVVMGLQDIWPVLFAVFVVYLIFVAIYYCPAVQNLLVKHKFGEEHNEDIPYGKLILIRSIINYVLVNITVVFFAVAVIKNVLGVIF